MKHKTYRSSVDNSTTLSKDKTAIWCIKA